MASRVCNPSENTWTLIYKIEQWMFFMKSLTADFVQSSSTISIFYFWNEISFQMLLKFPHFQRFES